MRVLFLTDRLSLRGGADQHLLQLLDAATEWGWSITVAYGREETGVELPSSIRKVRAKGLGVAVERPGGLGPLAELIADAEVIHLQNVMNPCALRLATKSGLAVVTVSDHRVFCPGPGRTVTKGVRCHVQMNDDACSACLPDDEYRRRLLELTAARRDALRRARHLHVLSRYMATELDAAGLSGATVLPPWIETSKSPVVVGDGFLLGGRLVQHKGVEIALEAWRRSGTSRPLRVAGAGPLARVLDEAEHLGWLDPSALRRELSRARALLFPATWQEPFGILGVEALAEGTPVIVASTGGTSEWSDAGCLSVPPGEIDAVVEAMQRLDDDDLAQRLGEEGQAMVRKRFSRSRLEPKLRALFEGADDAIDSTPSS